MNPDTAALTAYITSQQQVGVTNEAIYQSLVSSGWPPEVVHQAITGASAQQQTPPPYPHPQNANHMAAATPTQNDAGGFLKGRLNRQGFLLSIVYVLVYFVLLTVIALVGGNSRVTNLVTMLLGTVGVLATIPLTISIHVRRWHDLDQTGWMTLVALIPFFGFIISLLLFVLPGTNGPNKYGSSAQKSLAPKDILGFGK